MTRIGKRYVQGGWMVPNVACTRTGAGCHRHRCGRGAMYQTAPGGIRHGRKRVSCLWSTGSADNRDLCSWIEFTYEQPFCAPQLRESRHGPPPNPLLSYAILMLMFCFCCVVLRYSEVTLATFHDHISSVVGGSNTSAPFSFVGSVSAVP